MRKFLALLAAPTVGLGACGQASMPEVTVDQAVAAVRDCAQATGPEGLNADALIDMGWQQATAESDDGEPIELTLTILGKEEEGTPVIMSGKPGSQGNRICAITGGLDPTAGFDGLLAALSREFEPIDSSDGDHPFRVGRDFAIAARTGNGDSFRITVLESGDS